MIYAAQVYSTDTGPLRHIYQAQEVMAWLGADECDMLLGGQTQHNVTLKLASLKVRLLLQVINLLPCLLHCVHLWQLQQQRSRACAVSRLFLRLLCSKTPLLRLVQVRIFIGLCMRYISTSDNLQTSVLELSLRLALHMVHQLANSA